MSEFNSKKYYGFSMQNDPALLTTTKNFEFQYTLPENLDRVIQKVQLADCAESKPKKDIMVKYNKLKKQAVRKPVQPAQPVTPVPILTRDGDVETRMSRNDVRKVRNLSDSEIDALIGKAKSTVNMVSVTGRLDQQKQPTIDEELTNRTTTDRPEKIVIVDCRLPQPKWVEIEENSGHADVVQVTSTLPNVEQTVAQRQRELKQLEQLPQMHPDIDLILQSQAQTSFGIPQTLNTQQLATSEYYVDDSDYEYEMLKRPDYAKYCEKRPPVDEMTNVSNESGEVANFIEVEPPIPCMNLSFLKNAKPIRYTELTDEVLDEDRPQNTQMMNYIQGIHEFNSFQRNGNEKQLTAKRAPKKVVIDKKEAAKRKLFPFKPIPGSIAPAPSQTSPRKAMKHPPISSPQNSPKSNKSKSPRAQNPERAKPLKKKNLVLTKSLEDLKAEKMVLFAKMNGTQERIIEMLDKLRMNLLEAYIPDSSFEKNRRQKNAMEFSVRFSRNFLYPLRGMIDYLRSNTAEHFNSSSSNEACMRVASIYALMLQALQTYQRQLRFFILDQVPQKLAGLIHMVQSTTKLCLEKSVFDTNDPIIECLLERCSKFVGFLGDLHEQRIMSARDSYLKANQEKKPNSHEKYELKMFMNNLNMYEPKLVAKPSIRTTRKGTLNVATSSSNTTARKRPKKIRKPTNVEPVPPGSSEMLLTKAAEDAIATQIQSLDYAHSSDLMSSMQNITKLSLGTTEGKGAESLNPLNKAVIEALQMVTKQQVRQVLEPIIQTLGTALNKKKNSETIEAILKALNTKSISTAGEQNRRRCDAGNNRKWSKVPDVKTDSTSSLIDACTSLKVRKNTKKIFESRSTLHSSNKNRRSDKKKYVDSDDDGEYVDDVDGTTNDSDDLVSNGDWESVNEDELESEKQYTARSESTPREPKQQQRKQQQQPQLLNEHDAKREEMMRVQEKRLHELQELRQQLLSKKEQQQVQIKKEQQQVQSKKEQEEQRSLSKKNLKQQQPQLRHEVQQHQPKQQPHRHKEYQQQSKLHQRHPEDQKQQKPNRHQQQEQQKHEQEQLKRQQEHHQQQKQYQHLKQHSQKQQQQKQQPSLQQSDRQQQKQQPQKNSETQQKLLVKIPLQRIEEKVQKQQPPPRSNGAPQQQQLQQIQPPSLRRSSSRSTSKPHSAANSARTIIRVNTPKTSSEAELAQLSQQQKQQTRSHLPSPPCIKARSLRLLKKRRNLLRSPPPVPNGTPLTSARSIRGEIEAKPTDSDAAEICNVDVEELPRAVTNLNTNFNTEYINCDDNSANNKSGMNGSGVETANEAAKMLKPDEAAAAVSAIAAALDKINATDGNKAPNRMQSDVIKDFLNKCIFGMKSPASIATVIEEDEDEDDDDDDDDDDVPDGGDDNEHAEVGSKTNEYDVNGAVGEYGEVASYVSTSWAKKKKLQQQKAVRQEQQRFEMQALQEEPLSQSELHMQQLRQQKEQTLDQYLEQQELMQLNQSLPQQQKQLTSKQSEAETVETIIQELSKDQQDQQQRPPLNKTNQPNACKAKDNTMSELFTNVMDRNNEPSNRSKVDLKVEDMLTVRDQFLGMCNKNRFYANPTYSEPWKVFSSLSDKLANDIVNSVEEDFSIGVSKFVEDFLELETHN